MSSMSTWSVTSDPTFTIERVICLCKCLSCFVQVICSFAAERVPFSVRRAACVPNSVRQLRVRARRVCYLCVPYYDMLATARHPIARLSNPNETDSPMQSVFQLVGRHAAVYLGSPVCFLAIAIPTAYRDHTMGQKAKAFRPRNHRPHNFPCMSSSLQSHSTANSWMETR
jgi:hypothetical protein